MTPNLIVDSKHSVGKRIAANTGLMMGSKALAVILGLGSILIATKNLSAAELGIILFLHAYMLFFSEVTAFQSWQSLIRFGTDDIKENDAPRLAKLMQFGVKIDAISAVFGFAISVAIFSFIVWLTKAFPDVFSRAENFNISDLRNIAALYCILILFRQRGVSIGVFRLFDKFHILAIHSLIMPTTRFVGVLIAVITGAGFSGFLLAWFCGSLTAYIFLPLMALFELKQRHMVGLLFRAKSSLRHPRPGLWPFMIKSNIDSTLAASTAHLPALLVMSVFGSAWVAVYRIAEEAAKLLSEGFKLLDQVIYPELAKMVSLGQADKIWRLVTRTAVILLGFGLVIAVLVQIGGPELLSRIFSADYEQAAPLTSLLVLAAALMGIAAPLYPVLYAADHPERAIYARGTGVLVYISAFFIFSFTIGKMAPGWAAILSNASAVILLVFLARHTLKNAVREQKQDSLTTKQTFMPKLNLIGVTNAKIWGLPLKEWQERAFKKAGTDQTQTSKETVHIHIDWILSSALMKAFVSGGRRALIAGNIIIGVNGVDSQAAKSLIGQSVNALKETNIKAAYPEELDDGYNKALRKTEPPYALNVNETPVADIMRRQFASSYKGITDFVTKWIWPLPAFYVTRACAAMRLTPNMVTTVGLVLTFAAMYYFWHGQWALGFLTGWLMTFLDTVDGKLARTTMTYSWWGNIYDHGIDLIHPPFWYFAWFVGLGNAFHWDEILTQPMTFAIAAICVGYIVDRIIEGIFLGQHGFHIHVWTKVNSALRFFIARRNPNMFIFMVGICLLPWAADAGHWGFYAVAIWTWVCIAFNIISVIAGMLVKGPLQSWMDA
ncbi:CDP-alcohol phosphatidyltransferase family protein [Hellea balneolensis]|uniref:CDP-alcohol phosphatidyltransferase family protein n=1 Tax=Hellea balneolensis TaxID=287478 RepID=UPI00040190F3|nr:CDP-alcohol phosphatidyltransferase family protein [Hellea balneolensis]